MTRQRTREFGVRMALGATRGRILRLVLGEVMVLVLAGIFVGTLGALGAGRAIAAQLFGVGGVDVLVRLGAPVLLGLAAIGAAWLPSMRAAGVAPMEALRHE